MKKKSQHKKNKKVKENIKVDVTKEVGTINGFTIIEKFIEDKNNKKEEKKDEEKKKEIETKGELIDLSNLDDKNISFFKNWIIYDNPNESRFAKFFKELEEDEKKNETNTKNQEIEEKKETLPGDVNANTNSENVIYDNISSNPSENNSRDSKGSRELNDDCNFNFNYIEDTIPIFENNNNSKNTNEEKDAEKKEEELNLDLNINNIISMKDKRSTLMIKNIPNKFNQEYILNIINQNFKGTFDIFVLPTDINKYKNFGYAFINFTSSYYIPYFYFMFNGKMWFGTNSQKICKLAYSKVQGTGALLEHYPSKIVFRNEEALEVTKEQKYIIPNIYKLYFNECFPKEKIEEYKYYFVTKMPN